MKKMIIISISIIATMVLVIIVLSFFVKRKQNQNVTTPSQISVPELPTGTEKAKVSGDNLGESIRGNISKTNLSENPTEDVSFQSTDGEPLPLQKFEDATNIKIKPEIYDNLSQTDYSVFACKSQKGGAQEMGLIMRFKPGETAAYYADLYSKMDKNLALWEENMFGNLAPLLFPGEKISQKPVFKSTKYTTENGALTLDVRFANVRSDDGANLSVDYAVYAEDIYVFNSPTCLRKALDKYQPALEP